MQSFRTELENPVVEKDIIDLEKQIRAFHEERMPETKFRSLRLVRGIYGQRQKGVQMVRIKIPFGFLTFRKLLAIADVSDEYATGNLHLTTRQDIQIHFVSLDRTPELWAQLDKDEVTIREACGNTVRNVTASAIAGVDPDEPFDVSPYAYETFRYFLRNPICNDMARKFKVAFSSSESDTAWSFIHDVGLIPKVRVENGEEVRGFKVLIGGGLGAQPMLSKFVHEFLPEDQVIPYIESVIRVFDRYGERNNRNKARLKYVIANLGLEEVLRMVEEERIANKSKSYRIDRNILPETLPPPEKPVPAVQLQDEQKYRAWLKANVFEQKQKGFYRINIKVRTGDVATETARKLVAAVRDYVADDIRVAPTQGLILKFVRPEALPYLFSELDKLGLAEPGADSVADVTTCPGTDTCNLGISDSMYVTRVFEEMINREFPDLIYNNDIKIKISGCMNSCGQHGIASIGFHGSSAKTAGRVYPALQVLLGGGILGNGEGRAAEKVIKVPSKRGPEALRQILADYEGNKLDGERFHEYYLRRGKEYFYEMLKPLADISGIRPEEFVDWGQSEQFATVIGVGECASVVIDLVATLLNDSEEKLQLAEENLAAGNVADAIYHAYGLFINTAKALLLDRGVNGSTQIKIMNEFDAQYVQDGTFTFPGGNFREYVLRINKNEPQEGFAVPYIADARNFLKEALAYRQQRLEPAETNA